MPDNPHPFRLPGHDVLAITGRDAAKFAQAQFMSDVGALAPGRWHWSGWLTPKGRVIALFALLKFDEEKLWLILLDVLARDFAAQLQRYVFRSKVTLVPMDMCGVGSFIPPGIAMGSAFAIREEEQIELDMGGDGGPRNLSIRHASAPDDPDAASRWDAFDLAHGLPRLSASQREHWTPQQLSLDRLRAFSVKKGCYPGQEIVARTHFLGQAKRGLAAFRSASPIPVDADVELDGAAIGRIVSATPGEPCYALAVLPLDRGPGTLRVAGLGLDDIGLRDGLAR